MKLLVAGDTLPVVLVGGEVSGGAVCGGRAVVSGDTADGVVVSPPPIEVTVTSGGGSLVVVAEVHAVVNNASANSVAATGRQRAFALIVTFLCMQRWYRSISTTRWWRPGMRIDAIWQVYGAAS